MLYLTSYHATGVIYLMPQIKWNNIKSHISLFCISSTDRHLSSTLSVRQDKRTQPISAFIFCEGLPCKIFFTKILLRKYLNPIIQQSISKLNKKMTLLDGCSENNHHFLISLQLQDPKDAIIMSLKVHSSTEGVLEIVNQ